MKKIQAVLLGMALVLFVAASSWAGVIGYVWQNEQAAAENATLGQVAALGGVGTADAMFNPAAINYNSNSTGYTIGAFLNNPTFYNTSAGFDANANMNNSFYYFTGSTYLNAGDNSFVVPHDDGLQLKINGVLVVDQPGPTSEVWTPFIVNVASAGMYAFQLSYGECYGSPAVLAWTINGEPVGAPEPASMLLLGLGLIGLAGARFKK